MMSKEIAQIKQSDVKKSLSVLLESSCNNTINNLGPSHNNNYNYTVIINPPPGAIIKNDLQTTDKQENSEEVNQNAKVFEAIEDQKDLNVEAISKDEVILTNEEIILKCIWKYLDKEDKFNCTLVCKKFNNFISRMDYLHLNIYPFNPDEKPLLTRNYKLVYMIHYHFHYLDTRMLNILKHLRHHLNELNLFSVTTNVIALYELLRELPMLKLLRLQNLFLKYVEFSLEEAPQLLHLKNVVIYEMPFKRRVLLIFDSAPNIQSLSLEDSEVELNEFKYFLNKHKNSLTSLSIKNCSMESECDSNDFDCLDQLRKVNLIKCDEITLQLLSSKCMDWLTDLEVNYISTHKQKVNSSLRKYFERKRINKHQLSEYEAEAFTKPIVTKIKCTNTGNIITKFYHVHHCYDLHNNKFHDHTTCRLITLINLILSEIGTRKCNSFLSVQVREDEKDFKNIKYIYN